MARYMRLTPIFMSICQSGAADVESVYEKIERLQLATAATGAGVWDYNIDTDVLRCDDRWYAILGLDPSYPLQKIDDFKPYIHPDDVERATEIQVTFSELTARGEDYSILYRIIRPNGEVRWIKSAACVIEARAGGANRAVGAIIDVTESVVARTALAESEQRFKVLADTVPQILFRARADGTVDYINGRWREFAGVDDPRGAEDWLSLVHVDDRERVLSGWNRSLETGETFKGEFRYRHRSGDYRWMSSEATSLRDDEGAVVHWFGANTDIHAAKQLEAEREMVARELDHRLKNIYAIMTSLITLAVRDDPQMAHYGERLRNRILALVSAHDLIWRAEHHELRLHRLLGTILAPYENDAEPRLAIRGANPEIGSGTATPLALLFNELATNAAKHGALRSANGTVTIEITHTVNEVRIDWIENVVGANSMPASDASEGFGSTLFSLVERQLNARFKNEMKETGIRWHWSFPVTAFAP